MSHFGFQAILVHDRFYIRHFRDLMRGTWTMLTRALFVNSVTTPFRNPAVRFDRERLVMSQTCVTGFL